MPRYLGVDYGLERTGAAISDPEGRLAFPFGAFHLSRYKSRSRLLDDLAARAAAAGAEAIVIGLPLYPDGKESEGCRQVRNFAARLERRLGLPVHFEPEAHSTEQAARDLAEAGIRKKKRVEALDQQAACRILESFLARQRP